MHPIARLKTHALRRVMERSPGNCPGLVLRRIDEAIEAGNSLISYGNEALYRLRLDDGQSLCIVVNPLSKHVITVMTVPCIAHVASRAYQIGEDTIEKVKYENAAERDNKWRRLKRARQARERFL
jgi:hypothetical protein